MDRKKLIACISLLAAASLAAGPAGAITNGKGQDIFRAAAVFESSVTMQSLLGVASTGTASDVMAQIWRDGNGAVVSSVSATGVLKANYFQGNGSLLTNVPGDSLGNHVATTSLNMAAFNIVNAGSVSANAAITTYSSMTVAGNGGAYGLSVSSNITVAGGLFNTANGGVGIGTLTPAAPLNVYGGKVLVSDPGDDGTGVRPSFVHKQGASELVKVYDKAGQGNSWIRNPSSVLFLGNQSSENVITIGWDPDHTANTGVGILKTDPRSALDVGGTAQLRGSISGTGLYVDSSGNVGIGTAAPSALLHIAKGSLAQGTTTDLAIFQGNYTGAAPDDLSLRLTFQSSDANYLNNPFAQIMAIKANSSGGNPSGQLAFFTKASGNPPPSEKVRIDGSGNVGIGTSAPGAKLNVMSGAILVENPPELAETLAPSFIHKQNGYELIKLYNKSGSSTSYIRNPNASMYLGNVWHEQLLTLGYQSVGVNTTEPQAWLDVNGTALLRGSAGGAGLLVNSTGDVGLSTGAPQARLDVLAAGSTAADMAQIWRNSGGTIVSSMSATGALSVSAWASQSLAASGYTKLGPLIIQWGKTGSISSGGNSAVSFPVAFPTAVVNVQVTLETVNGANSYGVSVGGVTTSGFTAYSDGAVAGAQYWLAIGY